MSSGGCVSNRSVSPVIGWTKPRMAACSAWRARPAAAIAVADGVGGTCPSRRPDRRGRARPSRPCARGSGGCGRYGGCRRRGPPSGRRPGRLLGRRAEDLFDDIVRDRLAAAAAQHRHLLAVARGAAQAWRRCGRVAGLRRAAGQGDVGALDVVGGEQGREALVGGVGLGGDHHAGGMLVQPVHDARPRYSADAGQGGRRSDAAGR